MNFAHWDQNFLWFALKTCFFIFIEKAMFAKIREIICIWAPMFKRSLISLFSQVLIKSLLFFLVDDRPWIKIGLIRWISKSRQSIEFDTIFQFLVWKSHVNFAVVLCFITDWRTCQTAFQNEIIDGIGLILAQTVISIVGVVFLYFYVSFA